MRKIMRSTLGIVPRTLLLLVTNFLFIAYIPSVIAANEIQVSPYMQVQMVELIKVQNPLKIYTMNDYLFITCSRPNNITILKYPSLDQVASIPLASTPHFLFLDTGTSQAFVVCLRSSNISILDLKTLKVSHIIHLPSDCQPSELAMSKDGKIAYIGDGYKPIIYVVDVKKEIITRKIRVSGIPAKIILANSIDRLIVGTITGLDQLNHADVTKASVDIIDATSQQCLGSVTIPGSGVSGLTLSLSEKIIYALSDDALISAISMGQGYSLLPKPSAALVSEVRGDDLVYDQHMNYLYILSEDLNAKWINVVDAKSLHLLKRTIAGGYNLVIQQPRDNSSAKVFNVRDSFLTIVDSK